MVDLNGTLIVQFINFFILVFILSKFCYKPLLEVMQARKERIEQDLNDAQQAREESQRLEEQYKQQLFDAREEAKEIISHAIRQAEEVAHAHHKEVREHIAREKILAQKEILAEKEKAHAELRAEVITLSIAVAEKVLGKELTQEVDKSFVDEAISKLDGVEVSSK